jgi:hypothetical protein
MALVLCQQCLSWVEPIAEQCPQCDYPIDLRTPDPTLDELAAAIGPLVACLGPVRVSRIALPDRGQLYATAGGLFFVPDTAERVRLVPVNGSRRSFRSVLRTFYRASIATLRIGMPGTWRPYRSPVRVEIRTEELPLLSPDDGERLPRLLMENPGAFFFPRRSIRRINRTFSGWAVVRPNNLALRVKPMGDRSLFHERMSAFAHEIHEAVCR